MAQGVFKRKKKTKPVTASSYSSSLVGGKKCPAEHNNFLREEVVPQAQMAAFCPSFHFTLQNNQPSDCKRDIFQWHRAALSSSLTAGQRRLVTVVQNSDWARNMVQKPASLGRRGNRGRRQCGQSKRGKFKRKFLIKSHMEDPKE